MGKRARILIFAAAGLCAPAAAQRAPGFAEPIVVIEEQAAPATPPATTPAPPRPRPPRVTPAQRAAADAALARFTSRTLTPFGSEAEFRAYIAAVREYDRTRGDYYYSAAPGPAASGAQYAQAQPAPAAGQPVVQTDTSQLPCVPTPDHPCEGDALNDLPSVTVTGSRINPHNPSITNNQMRGVEEGDIVKQIDRYLLVLQDGRIFVIDTAAGGRRLALSERVNVYRNPQSDMWYDEMLVFGRRVLITGYSYDDGQTELAVFRLGSDGRLTREGVFRISSNDYYSGSNYATRLVGDDLVTYTPLSVSDMADADFKWPVVRRWLPEDDARELAYLARRARDWRTARDDPPGAGTPLLDAAGIYRPVRDEEDPRIHTVSVCHLGAAAPGRDLGCRTTAFAGAQDVQWYVTNSDVYLWTAPEESWRSDRICGPGDAASLADFDPAFLYRVPVSGGRPALVAARSMPPDQFAMQADDRNFYALARMRPSACHESYGAPPRLDFVSIPLARLGPTLADAPAASFTRLPSTPGPWVASRFTDHYLVYGGLSRFRAGYPDLNLYGGEPEYRQHILDELRPRPAYVVPVDRPAGYRAIAIGHTVIRAERVADDIVLTGYRDSGGLMVSLIDLGGAPRLASSALLAGRYESEGRSHAFNSLIAADGHGLMGLPTVRRIADAERYSWRSHASDLSFLSVDAAGRLRPIGELVRRFDYVDESADGEEDEDGVPGYKCEVSCIDWYGNSRPIFTDGRIYGLSGTELIEGRLAGGRIREVQRLNIALAPVPAR